METGADRIGTAASCGPFVVCRFLFWVFGFDDGNKSFLVEWSRVFPLIVNISFSTRKYFILISGRGGFEIGPCCRRHRITSVKSSLPDEDDMVVRPKTLVLFLTLFALAFFVVRINIILSLSGKELRDENMHEENNFFVDHFLHVPTITGGASSVDDAKNLEILHQEARRLIAEFAENRIKPQIIGSSSGGSGTSSSSEKDDHDHVRPTSARKRRPLLSSSRSSDEVRPERQQMPTTDQVRPLLSLSPGLGEADRRTVERDIDRAKLAVMFVHTYRFTADRTWRVFPDGTTYCETGDIPKMWLRDSAVQNAVYLTQIGLYLRLGAEQEGTNDQNLRSMRMSMLVVGTEQLVYISVCTSREGRMPTSCDVECDERVRKECDIARSPVLPTDNHLTALPHQTPSGILSS